MPKSNTFSREFKLEAIRLMEAGDKKASDLARELGVPRDKLQKTRQIEKPGKNQGVRVVETKHGGRADTSTTLTP